MKQQVLKSAFLVLGASTLMLSSCDKDDHDHDHEEELITTMELSFTPVGGGTTLTYDFDDPDGPGGNNPTQDQIVLAPNTTYNVTVKLLNKSVNPVDDITEEIDAEGEAHRFYYQPSAGSNVTVTNLNNDANSVPLGITSIWTTTVAANGNMIVTLRHYGGNPPNKATADPVNSSKSATDIEVNFVTRVQ